jgi:aminomethyltransferase
MTTMTETLQKTPLYETHLAWGGRMVDFSGWSLPVTFTGVAEEHNHTRQCCSVFDVSHMGRLVLTGADAGGLLDRICTRNLSTAEVGRSYYTHVCREDGGILDDMIVSRFESHWGVVCNASNRSKMAAWLESHREGRQASIDDRTEQTAMLAIQGPKTIELAEKLTGLELRKLGRYHLAVHKYFGLEIVVYRCGYTGEDGLEVVFPATAASMLVPLLVGTPESPHPQIKLAGLAARDTLRIEASMPLYGHELSESIDPLSAGQGWCVDLSKEFLGGVALGKLKANGLARRLVGLELDGKRIAREGSEVMKGKQIVGTITSGTLSPTLGKSIAMAYVLSDFAGTDAELTVQLRGRAIPSRVVAMPFYKMNKSAIGEKGL